jgi:hypothetical protein
MVNKDGDRPAGSKIRHKYRSMPAERHRHPAKSIEVPIDQQLGQGVSGVQLPPSALWKSWDGPLRSLGWPPSQL